MNLSLNIIQPLQAQPRQRFLVLDSFRGLAALSVVLFHMPLLIAISQVRFFQGGWLFVEFFFILSGFVLTHSYALQPRQTFKVFMLNRTFRLYPLHVLMFSVALLFEVGKLIAVEYGIVFLEPAFTGRNAMSEIVPNLLFLQSWLPFASSLSFNAPSWSLSVEYYVYIVFFLTLFVRGKLRLMLWTVMALAAFAGLALQLEQYAGVLRGLACFFAGAMLYMLYSVAELRLQAVQSWLFSAAEILALIVCFYAVSYLNDVNTIFASICFMWVVFVFAFEKGCIAPVLKAVLFQRLGRYSYSIYMTHSAVLFLIMSVVLVYNKFSTGQADIAVIDLGHVALNNILALAVVVLVFWVSSLTYLHVEKRWQIYGKRWIDT